MLRAIVMQAQSTDVDTVWVDGRVVKKDGQLVADTKRPSALLQAASERLHEKISAAGASHCRRCKLPVALWRSRAVSMASTYLTMKSFE